MTPRPFLRRVMTLAALLPLLGGCLAETRETIIADPVELIAYEGTWINARDDAARILSIKLEANNSRRAKLTYVMIHNASQGVSDSRMSVEATQIGDARYFEVTNVEEPPPQGERLFGRVSFGALDRPGDRDSLTVCFAETKAIAPAIEQGALKGEIERSTPERVVADPKVKITSSTAELRSYLAKNPLVCMSENSWVFARAKPAR